ncbi:OLC1v1038862C1 [Oldenlandia corymbosa var. corymbosa]|uniref:OLC1v1038862C1 n=1 Tax=Oldenlandia corymbosa var. corymbosa TaxID=529605 RepID=A0AAV1D3V6_OLDCO|nr:OLC1v1038862C1 [Oldenlandia corymbosa var. corymbosa]
MEVQKKKGFWILLRLVSQPLGVEALRIEILRTGSYLAILSGILSVRVAGSKKVLLISSYPCWQRACVESVLWVMHVKSFVADALGVVTICLVTILILLGLFCILYSFYFRSRIKGQGFIQLGYFSGPWIIRILLIVLASLWGLGEIFRLSLLRRDGRLINDLKLTWQEHLCKIYIVSNLGFAEPCLFLTLVLLLRASLQKSGTLSPKWNCKTAAYVILFCLPVFLLQLFVILIGPKFSKEDSILHKLPHYFTSPAARAKHDSGVAFCSYPLLSTIVLGLFNTIFIGYHVLLGRRILHLVINKALQKRVYTLICSVVCLVPLRVIFLGLSVRFAPEVLLFDTLAFLAFLSLWCCILVGICLLVYFPVADSLALRNLQKDIEARRRVSDEQQNDTVSLIANQSPVDESLVSSPGRNSAASTKRGSISFRTMDKDATPGGFVELSLFSPSRHATPPGSPRLVGWPMLPPSQSLAL